MGGAARGSSTSSRRIPFVRFRRRSTLVLASIVASIAACNARQNGGTTATPGSAGTSQSGCGDVPSAADLKKYLAMAPDSGEVGGLFHGRAEWAAVVNRAGELCAYAPSTDSAGGIWPGSQAVAKAKAYTTNAFSTDTLAFSTARLYTLAQPGHSLFGIWQPETFNPTCLAPLASRDGGVGKVCGGAIAFGGGVPIYRNGHIVGGLGLSGDTPCADHEMAKRVRDLAHLNPKSGKLVDDITYSKVDHPSIYTHPLCPNTWRNGQKIGDEPVAAGY
jgi:uncharacterized protein GlcG (DUF336 family)